MSRVAELKGVHPAIIAAAQAVHDLQHAYDGDNAFGPCDMCLQEAAAAIRAYNVKLREMGA